MAPDHLDQGLSPRNAPFSPESDAFAAGSPSSGVKRTKNGSAPDTHGVLERSRARGFSNDNLRAPVEIDYDASRKAARFLPDGSGFVYYPSGNMAMSVTLGRSGKRTTFVYADMHPSGGHALATFGERGQGSVMWRVTPDGHNVVRAILTPGTVTLYGRDGSLINGLEWGEVDDPLEMQLNAHVSLALVSSQFYVLTFRAEAVSLDFNAGTGRPTLAGSYLDRATGRSPSGKLEFNIPATPLDKLAAPKRRVARTASPLPAIASTPSRARTRSPLRQSRARGAESPIAKLAAAFDSMLPSPSLSPLRTSAASSRISRRSSPPGRTPSRPTPSSPARLRSSPAALLAQQPIRKRAVALRERNFDAYIRKVSASTLVVVVVAARSGPSANLAGNIVADVEAYYLDAVRAAGGARNLAWSLATADLAEPRLRAMLEHRYAVRISPTYLMFYAGRLVYASTELNGSPSYSLQSFVQQVEDALSSGQAGHCLSSGFKIAPTEKERQTEELEHSLKALLATTRSRIKSLTASALSSPAKSPVRARSRSRKAPRTPARSRTPTATTKW